MNFVCRGKKSGFLRWCALRESIILELLITILIGTCSACGKIHVLDGPGKASALLTLGRDIKEGLKILRARILGVFSFKHEASISKNRCAWHAAPETTKRGVSKNLALGVIESFSWARGEKGWKSCCALGGGLVLLCLFNEKGAVLSKPKPATALYTFFFFSF